jgi:hypothetical protein
LYNGDGTNVGGQGIIINTGWLNPLDYYEWAPLKVSVRGIPVFNVNTSGNVGIGTITPTAVLQLNGSGSNGAPLRLVSNSVGSEVGIGYYRNTDTSSPNTGDIWIHGATAFGVGDRNFGMGCNGTGIILSMFNNGNVGIGTASPSAKLDVVGSSSISTPAYFKLRNTGGGQTGASDTVYAQLMIGGDYGPWIRATQVANGYTDNVRLDLCTNLASNDMTVEPRLSIMAISGNVGIGKTNPNGKLQFSNGLDSRKIVLFEGANNDHQFLGFGVNANTLRYQVNTSTDSHVFYTGSSSSASTELMRIQGNGTVGIGTNATGAILQVRNGNTSYTTPTVSISDGDTDNGGTYGMVNLTRPSGVTDNKAHISFIRNGQSVFCMGYLQGTNTVGFHHANNLAGANGISIKSDGSVGIGITNPITKLQLQGTNDCYIRLSSSTIDSSVTAIIFDNNLSGYWHQNGYGNDSTTSKRGAAYAAGQILCASEETNNYENSYMAFHTCYDPQPDGVGGTGNTFERMRITSGGNVGIGTAAPQSMLHVNGTITTPTLNAPSGNYLNIANGAGAGQINLQGGNILFSNSNVGIGTSPNYKLDVNGTIRGLSHWYWTPTTNWYCDASANNQDFTFDLRNQNTYTGCNWGVWSDKNTRYVLCVTGDTERVGIGGTTLPGYTLHVVGDIYASGNITGLSDRRSKTRIEPIAEALNGVTALNGYTYFRPDHRPDERQMGLIAQEVLEVYPEAVTYDKENDRYGVNYGAMIAPLVSAVKEMRAEYQNQIRVLQQRIEVLEKLLASS